MARGKTPRKAKDLNFEAVGVKGRYAPVHVVQSCQILTCNLGGLALSSPTLVSEMRMGWSPYPPFLPP